MHWGNHYWGMHMFWWIFWVAIMCTFMFWLMPMGRHRRHRSHDDAVEELRRTYASGQISEEEYRHRLAVLTEQREPQQRAAP